MPAAPRQAAAAEPAVPSHHPHRAAHRAKPRVPDQAATSSPALSCVPRARPHKHTITGHQCVPVASRRPPRACRCPRLPLHCIAARRVLSNSTAVASRRPPVANPAGRAARTAINRQARAPRARPRPRYHLPAPINSPHRSPPRPAPPRHFPLSPLSSHRRHPKPPLLQTARRRRSPSTSRPSPR
jgi:hypothetical protein